MSAGVMSQQESYAAQAAELVREAERQRLVRQIKVGLVILVLLALLSFMLLQLQLDPAYMVNNAGFVIQGLLVTIGVSLASITLASVLGLLGALGRLSSNAIALGVSTFYISLIRGTPLLVQIYIIYLGLPQLGKQITAAGYPRLGELFILSALQSGILALSLNYGAYMTEIFRAGIQAVSPGQWQAAAALGMSRWQTLRFIVLPQAIRTVIPAIGNQFISMQKDSTLVSLMGIWEITYRANRLARKDSKFMEMFLLAAAVYWVLTIVSEWLQRKLEERMARSERH
ncbi:MAG: amino acid ABC transporter permease [Caldilineales bacterium]|nr:amino acid ABC transporter permease [Caldilineales bacterium]